VTRQAPGDGRPARLLLYSMYDLAGPDRGPVVRIERMRAALGSRCQLSVLSGGRAARVPRLVRWLAKGGLGSVDAIYVEASSSFATPVDLAFLALARLRGRPVGVYFRDAYQLFRGDYPLARRRQHVLDWLWRLATPVLKRIASRHFAPSAGLARALDLRSPVLLPPGTDPGLPVLGPGSQPIAAYVGALSANLGMHLLVEAVELVRRDVPEARLRLITPADPADRLGSLPPWIEWLPTGRTGLADALRDVAVCVIPFRITPYTDLAVPLKLMDYLAFGKPIVATACAETAAIVGPAHAALVVPDDPPALAAAITRVIRDHALAGRLATNARALAEAPASTWGARADTVLETLLGPRPVGR
jgi:glycosyltransferase involved in cell wall biosynthesis